MKPGSEDMMTASARSLLPAVAIMALLWTIVPALIHTAPPLDVVESALWGREWVVGTYKHPGMPAWVIEAGRWLNGGRIGWPVYLASQLFNLATLALTFALARDVAGERVAVASVLSLLGVEYFSWRSIEFNHTLAQMPFWVGAAWCAWRAVETDNLRWWRGLGAMAALGLYGKLSNAVLLIVIAGWILSTRRGRASLATPGPWLGALVFGLLCIPLVLWLVQTGFQPLAYAEARGREQSVMATLLFPANALLQAAPIALVLALAGFFGNKTAADAPQPELQPDAQNFLWVMAFVPPALSIALALLGGSGLRASWLAPALPLIAVALIARYQQRLNTVVMANLRKVALALAVLIPIGYALIAPQVGSFGSAPPLRVSWPQADIARTLAAAWSAETNKPLKIIAGNSWAAGLVGLDHPDRPSILTEGELSYSPWFTADRLKREGALVVWSESRGGGPTPAMDKMISGRPVQERRIPFPRGKAGSEIVFKYVVLPPL